MKITWFLCIIMEVKPLYLEVTCLFLLIEWDSSVLIKNVIITIQNTINVMMILYSPSANVGCMLPTVLSDFNVIGIALICVLHRKMIVWIILKLFFLCNQISKTHIVMKQKMKSHAVYLRIYLSDSYNYHISRAL